MEMIKDTFQITKKDLKEFTRDSLRLISFFLMPIFMMVLIGFIFPNQNSLKNIPIGIANQDKGKIGKDLEKTIEDLKLVNNTPAFKLKKYSDIEAIKEGIKKQEISGGIVIPSDFSENISKNKESEITIVEDQINPQISALVTQSLSKLVEGFGKKIGAKNLSEYLISIKKESIECNLKLISQQQQFSEFNLKNKQNLPTQQNQTLPTQQKETPNFSPLFFVNPIKAKIEGLISGNPSYFEFLAPGIIAMIVMTAVLTGLAASVSREKEQGTLDGFLIAPISRFAIIIGKALAQAIRGMIQGIIVLFLAVWLFDVVIYGNVLLIALVLLLGVFSFVGLGILVSAIASEQETATQILFMFQLPMLFLSGVFFPIQQMPKTMQYISKAIPLTYAIQALRKVLILGAGLNAIRGELIVLVLFGTITLFISVPLFKRIITR
jgi:ABC-2 type transport system permease protein